MLAPPTLAAYQNQAVQALRAAGIENPALDAALLIGHALGLSRTDLLSQAGRILSTEEQARLDALIARRCRHESVSRIIGTRPFWTLTLALNEATLEPRPDSETLIEATLAALPDKNASLSILDLGTGTGCLLLSLLSELPNARGLGIDKAPRAVEQATENARINKLEARALFQTGDWLEGIADRFDIIISNPPYIPHGDIAALMPEVRDYDPALALIGGPDGLAVYRHLIPQLRDYLNEKGMIVFEVGAGQADSVAYLLDQEGFTTSLRQDLGGIARCVIGNPK